MASLMKQRPLVTDSKIPGWPCSLQSLPARFPEMIPAWTNLEGSSFILQTKGPPPSPVQKFWPCPPAQILDLAKFPFRLNFSLHVDLSRMG